MALKPLLIISFSLIPLVAFANSAEQLDNVKSQSTNINLSNNATNKPEASGDTSRTAYPATQGNPSMSNTTLSLSEKNILEAKKFFEENKKQSQIRILASGLQYEVLQEGNGSPPGPSDYVTVHYRGTLLNGTEFDSSYARKEPSTFPVNAVIAGWIEALQLMKPGAKWKVYIPAQLAYGSRGAGHVIGPNAALIFDIELLSVKPNLESGIDNSMPDEEIG